MRARGAADRGAGACLGRSGAAGWGTLDTNLQSTAPVALGGRGNVVGSYNSTATVFVGAYFNWKF